MLDVSGTSTSTPKQIDEVQNFGRVLSASGFTLLVLGVFSRTGYLLLNRRHWLAMGVFMVICSLPFVMTFGEVIFSLFTGRRMHDAAFDPEMAWSMLPLMGIAMLVVSFGLRRRWVLCGIIVMAWPAMFFGQKLMVERYLVSPTSWQERVNARYMLMARSGAEDCLLSWGELDFCDAQYKNEDLRSLNAVFGAMMMYAPDEVVRQVAHQKEDILINLTNKEGWFGVDEAYGAYMQKVDFAKGYIDKKFIEQKKQFMSSVYWPYKRASDGYLEVIKPENINGLINDAWQDIDRKTDSAWESYLAGVDKYKKTINGFARDIEVNVVDMQNRFAKCRNSFCKRTVEAKSKYIKGLYARKLEGIESLCGGDLLKYSCQLNKDQISRLLRKKSDIKFKSDYGYPPTLTSKSGFLSYRKSHQVMNDAIKVEVAKAFKRKGIDLQDWQPLPMPLTKEYFSDYMRYYIVSSAKKQWHDNIVQKFGKFILPGLRPTELYEVLSGGSVPVKKDFKVLSKKEFLDQYMMDEFRARAVSYFDNIMVEAPLYANGLKKSQLGKDFIRALYVPPIALGLSLIIVVLTIGKNVLFLLGKIFQTYLKSMVCTKRLRYGVAAFIWAFLMAVFILFVVYSKNDYTKTAAYQIYYNRAYDASPITAQALDAIARVQPFMYRQGVGAVKIFGIYKWW